MEVVKMTNYYEICDEEEHPTQKDIDLEFGLGVENDN